MDFSLPVIRDENEWPPISKLICQCRVSLNADFEKEIFSVFIQKNQKAGFKIIQRNDNMSFSFNDLCFLLSVLSKSVMFGLDSLCSVGSTTLGWTEDVLMLSDRAASYWAVILRLTTSLFRWHVACQVQLLSCRRCLKETQRRTRATCYMMTCLHCVSILKRLKAWTVNIWI